MTIVTIPNDILPDLQNAVFGAKLCDPQGNVIGFYYPNLTTEEMNRFESPLSPEEIERRCNEPGGRSLEDVLTDLKKLG